MPPRFKAGRKTRMSSIPEAMSTTRRQLKLGARKQDIIQGADCAAKTIEKPIEGQEYPVLGLQRSQPTVSNPGPDTRKLQKSTLVWPSAVLEGKALASKWRVDRYAEAQRRLKDNDLAPQVPMHGSEWQCEYPQRTPGQLNVVFMSEKLQRLCSIATLVGILPIETSELMMREHQLPRNSPTYRGQSWDLPLPLGMLWYLVADEGCSPAVSARTIHMRYPDYSSSPLFNEEARLNTSFDCNNPNGLMEEAFRRGIRFVDCNPQYALKQDWVSMVHKRGIEMHERTCAHLSSASLCICTREERLLRRLFRRDSQLEKDRNLTALAFEDKDFMDLKKRVLGRGGQCSCPPIGVAILGGPTTPGLPAFFAKECPIS